MDGFYVSMVFFGVLLVLFSLICLFLDKRKVFTFLKNYDEKKQELVEIINDAQQMIDELNRFSDYIVNQMDLKNEEMNKNLKAAEEKMDALKGKMQVICKRADEIDLKASIETAIPAAAVMPAAVSVQTAVSSESALADQIPVAIAVNGTQREMQPPKPPARKSDKVIPINNKYSEVIRLSTEGLQGLEIAKRLGMGKGEVDLILGLRK